MTGAIKLIPLLLSWTGIVAVICRYSSGRRTALVFGSAGGFVGGVTVVMLLLVTLRSGVAGSVIKTVTGGSFLLLWIASLAALYRVTGTGKGDGREESGKYPLHLVSAFAPLAGLVAGALGACRLVPPGSEISLTHLGLLGVSGVLLAVVGCAAEGVVPVCVTVTGEALLAVTVSLLLFVSSFSVQLDLFSPLTMKVMKFIHDFVHQFFESMLLPDHLFVRPEVWTVIGYLFSSGVGFWGGLVVWFAPVLLVIMAIRLERLPTVAHIRQGAQRRTLLAAHIRERRCRLILPWFALLILAAALFRSSFPDVEYWDPKPLPVAVQPSGAIVIPIKGDIDLEDGRLHKYVVRQGERTARFMVLKGPDGRLTVTLDACAICKPDGYGQTEGMVICYYCKTLIPLETVGKPGGCNPVPVPFTSVGAGISIDAATVLNRWGETVTATTRIEGGGK